MKKGKKIEPDKCNHEACEHKYTQSIKCALCGKKWTLGGKYHRVDWDSLRDTCTF